MFQGLQESQLPGALEALLFVTDEPVGTIALADMLEVDPADVERALVELRARFEDEERGVQLREVAGGWRLYTHPVYHELVEKYVLSWDTRKLSQAAMETLAIVAYSQPVTRAGVASVRGVNSDSSINSLVEKGLVREAGTADAPGNPVLYATTRAFLEKFGLRSVADLPDLDQFAPDDDTRAFIRERLSATREPVRVSDEARMDAPGADEGDGFDGVEFDFDGEGEATVTLGEQLGGAETAGAERPLFARVDEAAEDAASASAQSLLAEAMASGLGLVEKIDFDELTFETDDE
ncbi:SMC-Scp complex subunit ScpB [Gordonibacter sp. 28C]|uniref:SMC-Scp complex subunit ScpB n=1 Tax=Gordonibacter sp. 28C TaxID=2078569 RepID=UPI000DF7DC84|nr:SMC-Scp complex subunit ScpB [Gordonibacter sp. 28C]RDB61817.1 SMC-Scp complex subunit ScpB [Gordonibacter sp. 28C]